MKFTKIVSKIAITLLISMHITSFGMKNGPAFIEIKNKKLNFEIKDISPDCKYAVSTPTNRKLVIYNLDDLSVVHKYEQIDEHTEPNARFYQAIVKFSPRGEYVIAGWQKAVILYGVHNKQQDILYEHLGNVKYIDFSSNSTRIASIDENGLVIVYDMAKRKEVCRYNHDDKNKGTIPKIHPVSDASFMISHSSIMNFCISPDGNFVASRSHHTFTLYDVEKKEKIYQCQAEKGGYTGFSQNSKYLLFITTEANHNKIVIYDIITRKELLNKTLRKDIIRAHLNHNNRYLALELLNRKVEVYNISNPKKMKEIDELNSGFIEKLFFCPDNRHLYAITNKTFIIRNIEKRKNIFKYFNNAKIKAIRLSSEYDKLVLFDGYMNLTAFKTNPSHDFYKHNRIFSPLEKEDKAERIRFLREEENLYRKDDLGKSYITLDAGPEEFNVSKIFLLM